MSRINCFVSAVKDVSAVADVWDEALVEMMAGGLVNRIYLMGQEAPGVHAFMTR